MSELFEFFHFMRPLWLVVIAPMLVLWWLARPKTSGTVAQASGIAPHLAAALEVTNASQQRLYPIDGVALTGILLSLAAAGPTWDRAPNPLLAETVPLVVALKVAPSMENSDLAPTRLERAKFKIMDLIEVRAGARTGLVAYAGSAHRVAPLTEDPNILRPLLEGLTPQIMPVDGDNAASALDLAIDVMSTSEFPGAVLFVLDDLTPADVDALNTSRNPARPPMVFLVAAPEAVALPQLGRIDDAAVVRITPDEEDVALIERKLRSVHRAALAKDERLRWEDRGWWLAWPIAILAVLWFRRGWTMRWGAILLATLLIQPPCAARADGWVDWFLTPDQQGRLAFEDNRFAEAGEAFENPMWKGHAKYRAGQYDEAIAIFQKLDTAEAAFAQGMAEIRNRQYRPAVRSFETALARQPDFPAAERNREVAQAIVDFVETTQEQSDTGEEAGIGADDVVFDNESARGAETQLETPREENVPLSSDQWIQAIDTNMGDFLRGRFLLENAQRAE